jgi:hypothetical protein
MIKHLWALELEVSNDVTPEVKGEFWVIHTELDADGVHEHLCVYQTRKEAVERAAWCEHKSRIVKFARQGG